MVSHFAVLSLRSRTTHPTHHCLCTNWPVMLPNSNGVGVSIVSLSCHVFRLDGLSLKVLSLTFLSSSVFGGVSRSCCMFCASKVDYPTESASGRSFVIGVDSFHDLSLSPSISSLISTCGHMTKGDTC